MMRLRGLSAFFCMGLALAASPARAAEESVGDWRFELGSKVWIQRWDTAQNGAVSKFVNNNAGLAQFSNHISANHALGVSGIPYLYVGWRKWFVTGSYSGSNVFNFPATREVIANVNGAAAGTAFELESKIRATRTEGDFNLGYMLFPQVGVTAGYKAVRLNFDEFTTGSQVGTPATKLLPRDNATKYMYDGFVAGIAAGADLGAGFQIYGNGGGGFMSIRGEDRLDKTRITSGSAAYELVELGFKWAYPALHLKTQAGYRFQGIQSSLRGRDMNTNATLELLKFRDVTSGYILGLSATF